jgi:hypothetical protein
LAAQVVLGAGVYLALVLVSDRELRATVRGLRPAGRAAAIVPAAHVRADQPNQA